MKTTLVEALTLLALLIVGTIIWAMAIALLTGRWTLLFAEFESGGAVTVIALPVTHGVKARSYSVPANAETKGWVWLTAAEQPSHLYPALIPFSQHVSPSSPVLPVAAGVKCIFSGEI
jgi:hypothetical protein